MYVFMGKLHNMKQLFFFSALLFFGANAWSQTKLIAHKSHSGSAKNFKFAWHSSTFDKGESNFGQAPQHFVRNSRLDTVRLLPDRRVVMITSESCHWEDHGGRPESNPELWSAGKDTLNGHPLFNAEHTPMEIRKTLKEEYYFVNSPSSVVLIGFDAPQEELVEKPKLSESPLKLKKQKRTQKEEEQKPVEKRPSLFFMIVMALLSSILKLPY
jgi:hypothetical protein